MEILKLSTSTLKTYSISELIKLLLLYVSGEERDTEALKNVHKVTSFNVSS